MNRKGSNHPAWPSFVYVPKSPPSGGAQDCARLLAVETDPAAQTSSLGDLPGSLVRDAPRADQPSKTLLALRGPG